jgi:hypothetical protein
MGDLVDLSFATMEERSGSCTSHQRWKMTIYMGL